MRGMRGGMKGMGPRGAVLATLLVLAMAGPARSEPDYFRVVGVAAGTSLNVRAEPAASARRVGTIPHDADGVRNLGCRGGPTLAEWEAATPARRAASRNDRWCKVAFGDVEGWAAGRFLGEGGAPAGGR
ncbi:MAG: SH3 domain-containing protein [Roseateles sp.]|uniref:SH3 domain-containing protein n=1 Tax=Roseateles sp. TaxID=1971397 RepID=UPI0039E76379